MKKTIWITLIMGLCVGTVLARDVPFDGPQAVTITADGASAVVAVDIDGDGDMDLLLGSSDSNQLDWFENTDGAGTYGAPNAISSGAEGVGAVAAADLDGDGDLDVLAASAVDNSISWYENTDGAGDYGLEQSIAAAALGASDVIAADLDRDGDLDVLSASSGDDTVQWFQNTDGLGTFAPGVAISITVTGASAVVAADVDGDGDLDILTAGAGDGELAWHQNTDGAGTFGAELPISASAAGASDIAAADVDRDGDVDLVVTAATDNELLWHENTDGAGTFGPEQSISTGVTGASAVAVADVDGDGDLDIAVVSEAIDTLSWFENTDGAGAFGTGRIVTAVADGVRAIAVGDLDGDGDAELATASAIDDTLAVFDNTTIHRSGLFPIQSIVAQGLVLRNTVTTADVDQDGDMDIIAASQGNDTVAWHENLNGAGVFGPQITITAIADGAVNVVPCDIDRDGDPDVVVAATIGNSVSWYENTDGAGAFGLAQPISTDTFNVFGVDCSDLDGDGDVDVTSASSLDNKIAWYENTDGAGLFGPQQVISTAASSPLAVLARDVDADGDMDLITASSGDNTVAWFENNGAASFGTLQVISNTAASPTSVFAGDLDGDGDLDVLSSSFSNQRVQWYSNLDGAGSFGTPQTITIFAQLARSVHAADLDNDGDLDVLSASQGDKKIAWYENLGGGSFGPQILIATNTTNAFDVWAADLDGDGDMDALSGATGDVNISWYPNRGGQFALITTDTSPAGLFEGGTADVLAVVLRNNGRPGDGDLELSSLELLFEESPGDPLSDAQVNALVEVLTIHLDNGSGEFEEGQDPLVAQVAPLALSAGRMTIPMSDGDTLVQVPTGGAIRLFVVLQLTNNASSQDPSAFGLTHVTESSSTAEDRDHDIPLVPEYAANVVAEVGTVLNPIASGQVPDGNATPGPPLTVAREANGDLTLSWYLSCQTEDIDYAVFEGDLGDFYSHRPVAPIGGAICTTGAGRTVTLADSGATSHYYLAVPLSLSREGSYGTDSAGSERPQGPEFCKSQLILECSSCLVDADCADGNFCNGEETCVSGTCLSALPPVCDDDNSCTDDSCSIGINGCDFVGNDQNSCDDGLACTSSDHCSNSDCIGTDECTEGLACSPLDGTCDLPSVLTSFQQEFNGYLGTLDTYIEEIASVAFHGAEDEWEWDDQSGSPTTRNFGLLQFGEIFGSGVGQIPLGSSIVSATVTYTVSEEGGIATVHEMLVPWSETDGLAAVCGLVCEAGVDYETQPIATATAASLGPRTIDVTQSLRDWAATPLDNRGWIFVPATEGPGAGGGSNVFSSEYFTNVFERPKLSVVYIPVACTLDEDCDDLDSCTTDTCNVDTCENVAIPGCCNSDADCDDDDACTTDSCPVGTCDNVSVFCDDGISCTTEQCDAILGCQSFDDCLVNEMCSNATDSCLPLPSPPLHAFRMWRYLADGTDQGTLWSGLAFDDSLWPSGAGELGYGDGDEATVVYCGPSAPFCDENNNITTYFRKKFTVPDAAAVNDIIINVKRDDGIVIYINGTEVFRDNMPVGSITYLTPAASSTDDDDFFQVFPSPNPALLVTGTNVVAVEIHQRSGTSSDISFDMELITLAGPDN